MSGIAGVWGDVNYRSHLDEDRAAAQTCGEVAWGRMDLGEDVEIGVGCH